MEIKYQQNIKDVVSISDNKVNVKPNVVDYSSTYKYNQYSITSLVDVPVQFESPDVRHINDPAITNDNIIVSRKINKWGNPLFYQYQLKYDCIYPENIKVYDSEDKLMLFNVEYGYLDINSNPLGYNTEKLYDPLDSFTLHGQLESTLVYNSLSVYSDLPFNTYGSCLFSGQLYYEASLISSLDVNIMSIYFLMKDVSDFTETSFLNTDRGSINIVATGGSQSLEVDIGSSESIPLASGVWYRLDYYYDDDADTSEVKLHNLDSLTTETRTMTASMFKDAGNLHLAAGNNVCFDLGFFKDSLPGISNPLFIHRYSKSITWNTERPSSSPYRIRLLFENDTSAIVVYDGVGDTGALLQNRKEEINYRLIYKKYTNVTSNDWVWDSLNDRIVLKEILYAETYIGETIYVQPAIENQVQVFYDNLDKKIHVRDGTFRSDDYGGSNNDYYYIPEYEKIPFASDNQTVFRPYYTKMVREKANLISPYEIKISRFFIYEGDYPDYVIPYSYEVYRYFDSDDNLQKWTSGVDFNFMSTRGINIYKNGVLMDNSEIVNYNMYNGNIVFRNKFNANDKIEVTYLRKIPDFILTYPLLNVLVTEVSGGIETHRAFRLYLRTH